MTGHLLVRGMLVGLFAGILAFGFAKVFGEPQVDKAIAFEELMAQMHHEAPEEALVSREVQSTIGLFTGIAVYSISLGGIFALVFAYSVGRIGAISPRGLAALLALAAFVTLIFVPELKYPANPPSVGDPETIKQRTTLFFLMLLVSIVMAVIAVNTARKLIPAVGVWGGSMAAIALYIVVMAIAGFLFPAINEVPADFSAVVLWQFRVASLGIQVVIWTTTGLAFGWLTERALKRVGYSAPA